MSSVVNTVTDAIATKLKLNWEVFNSGLNENLLGKRESIQGDGFC